MLETAGSIVLRDEKDWDDFIASLSGPEELTLLSVSRTNTNQRVYQRHNRVLKIARLHGPDAAPILQEEAEICEMLAGSGNADFAGSTYKRLHKWEILEMPAVAGRHFDEAWRDASPGNRLLLIAQVLRKLQALTRLNVSHRDLRPGNIVVGDTGAVTLIDFGHAKRVKWPMALVNDVVGVPRSGIGPKVSFTKTLAKSTMPALGRPARSIKRTSSGPRE
jgi:predicted Ser/Thr protein kinase